MSFKKIIIGLAFILCFVFQAKAEDPFATYKYKFPEVTVRKYGTLVGIQRGKYSFIELGVEQQFKQLTLKSPRTFAWNALLEYSWDANSLGLKVGSWYKAGRMGFTFGGDVIGASDFTNYKVGVAPALGFKVIGIHALASYNFFIKKEELRYNTLHLSLRYYISRSRDYDIKNKN
jgi:hypothetical protein